MQTTQLPVDPTTSIQELLDNGSLGELLAVELAVKERGLERLSAPDAFEHIAEYESTDDFSDLWGLAPSDTPVTTELSAPENAHDTLPEINAMIRSIGRLQQQLRAVQYRLNDTAYATDRHSYFGIPHNSQGWKDVDAYLRETMGESGPTLRKHQRRRNLTVREHTPFSEEESRRPKVTTAFEEAEVSEENSDILVETFDKLETYAKSAENPFIEVDEVWEAFEDELISSSKTYTPYAFRQHTTQILELMKDLIHPDGQRPDAEERKPNTLRVRNFGTHLEVFIRTDAIDAEGIQTLITPALTNHYRIPTVPPPGSKPSEPEGTEGTPSEEPSETSSDLFKNEAYLGDSAGEDVDLTDHGSNTRDGLDPETPVAESGEGRVITAKEIDDEDTRSREEKAHDQFMSSLLWIFRVTTGKSPLPRLHGAPLSIGVEIDYQTLAQALEKNPGPIYEPEPYSSVVRKTGSPPKSKVLRGLLTGKLNLEQVRAWACDAGIIPIMLNSESQILDMGREKRTVTPAQFRGLLASQRGCQAPGCTTPGHQCHAHHIKYFSEGGDTDRDNLILLCQSHHIQVHDRKWHIHTADDGTFWFRAASWFSENQELRKNTYWDYQ